MFLPLTIKGGFYISSKCEGNEKFNKSPKYKPTRFAMEDKAKTISNEANARHEIHNHTIQKNIKDLEVNPYKDAMLKESDRKRDLVPMEEWSILSDHVKYVTHGESETFQKFA